MFYANQVGELGIGGEMVTFDLFKQSLCDRQSGHGEIFHQWWCNLGSSISVGNRRENPRSYTSGNSTQQLAPEKLMIGRFCFLLGLPIFRGYIKFPGSYRISYFPVFFFWLAQEAGGEVRFKMMFLEWSFVVKGETWFWLKGFGKYSVSTVLLRLLERWLCMEVWVVMMIVVRFMFSKFQVWKTPPLFWLNTWEISW